MRGDYLPANRERDYSPDDVGQLQTGRVAKNSAIVFLLQERLDIEFMIPSRPEHTGTIGAALHAKTS